MTRWKVSPSKNGSCLTRRSWGPSTPGSPRRVRRSCAPSWARGRGRAPAGCRHGWCEGSRAGASRADRSRQSVLVGVVSGTASESSTRFRRASPRSRARAERTGTGGRGGDGPRSREDDPSRRRPLHARADEHDRGGDVRSKDSKSSVAMVVLSRPAPCGTPRSRRLSSRRSRPLRRSWPVAARGRPIARDARPGAEGWPPRSNGQVPGWSAGCSQRARGRGSRGEGRAGRRRRPRPHRRGRRRRARPDRNLLPAARRGRQRGRRRERERPAHRRREGQRVPRARRDHRCRPPPAPRGWPPAPAVRRPWPLRPARGGRLAPLPAGRSPVGQPGRRRSRLHRRTGADTRAR